MESNWRYGVWEQGLADFVEVGPFPYYRATYVAELVTPVPTPIGVCPWLVGFEHDGQRWTQYGRKFVSNVINVLWSDRVYGNFPTNHDVLPD